MSAQAELNASLEAQSNEFLEAHIDRHAKGFAAPSCNSFSLCDQVTAGKGGSNLPQFPAPKGIDVNMMPIDLWDVGTVPGAILAGYQPWIEAVQHLVPRPRAPARKERKKKHIAYLTVRESQVQPGQTQSRPGLHIEMPGSMLRGGEVMEHQAALELLKGEFPYGWGW